MTTDGPQFEFEYSPGKIVCGEGCVAGLGDELTRRNLSRAMVVSGSTVGSTPGVMDPVRDGLGDALVELFDETTPEKYLKTAVEGARVARVHDVDVLVAVGGGSSLDTAKTMSALLSHDAPPAETAEAAIEEGTVPVAPDGDPAPVAAVPTTLAGADLSVIAGVKLTLDPGEAPDREIPNGSVSDSRLMPAALFYDPDLYRTTPASVLAPSAMNGFNKGVEMLYSPYATPVTDGTAVRGLRLLQSGLGTLRDDPMDDERLLETLSGVVNVQYGISTPGRYKASIVHAFGHGFSHDYDAHQGTVHGIVTPHVLRYVFDEADARRDLLAEAFDVRTDDKSDEEVAGAVVDAVVGVRDDLELPTRLREMDGLERDHLPSVAEEIRGDGLMDAAPEGVDPTVAEITEILEAAW
ncbi:iron-containing alcohol dehydrogenase family protein [Halopelagius longus]|uniref:Alcohol dehydrogenase, class IV n=1 Tax=Halopelagius longus TaxID=1236180 RepID=A0A1H1G1K1_9EURY|nr:iron-containing alcohol dehydrogenase family protein [Halopelagius longus]RDI69898.1 iron-containing alcohol dehydrogenase [Halopelagius longus]SDR07060.1 Alcohol dehydrogenase, class IV [Halopelagius longus]